MSVLKALQSLCCIPNCTDFK